MTCDRLIIVLPSPGGTAVPFLLLYLAPPPDGHRGQRPLADARAADAALAAAEGVTTRAACAPGRPYPVGTRPAPSRGSRNAIRPSSVRRLRFARSALMTEPDRNDTPARQVKQLQTA